MATFPGSSFNPSDFTNYSNQGSKAQQPVSRSPLNMLTRKAGQIVSGGAKPPYGPPSPHKPNGPYPYPGPGGGTGGGSGGGGGGYGGYPNFERSVVDSVPGVQEHFTQMEGDIGDLRNMKQGSAARIARSMKSAENNQARLLSGMGGVNPMAAAQMAAGVGDNAFSEEQQFQRGLSNDVIGAMQGLGGLRLTDQGQRFDRTGDIENLNFNAWDTTQRNQLERERAANEMALLREQLNYNRDRDRMEQDRWSQEFGREERYRRQDQGERERGRSRGPNFMPSGGYGGGGSSNAPRWGQSRFSPFGGQ